MPSIAAIRRFVVRHDGSRAYYSPSRDEIVLPPFERFEAPEHYYAVSLHEHAHLSGAKHRLAREFGKRFGDNAYAFEELVAELTSAYLCAELGIPGVLRHPEYLASWVAVLRADARALFSAGAKASQAAEDISHGSAAVARPTRRKKNRRKRPNPVVTMTSWNSPVRSSRIIHCRLSHADARSASLRMMHHATPRHRRARDASGPHAASRRSGPRSPLRSALARRYPGAAKICIEATRRERRRQQ